MNNKMIAFAAVAAMLSAAPAVAGPGQGTSRSGANSPTAQNQASCMAKARAQFNSTGGSQEYGDRTQGGFGEAQSAFVEYLDSIGVGYGEWFQASEWRNRNTCPQ